MFFEIKKRLGKNCLKLKNRMICNQLQIIRFLGLWQMVLMTSKTSLQKWNGVFCSRRFLLCFFKLVQLRINTACVSAGVDSCMNSCRWFAKLERAATSVARSTTLPGCGWHHNAYPPETTAGGSVFREAVSKTLPASASDQRNAFPEVIKIPESKATAFQTLDSAVYSFNRTVGEIILDAVKTSCMMWKRSMMIRAFGNNALMYWAFRSTTTDFTAAFSQCLLA